MDALEEALKHILDMGTKTSTIQYVLPGKAYSGGERK